MKLTKLLFSVIHGILIIAFITTVKLNAQEFPLKDFMKVYFNKEKYGIEQYQTDTTLKSKKEFLNRLKVIDPDSYNNLRGYMEMNGDQFPQSFFITDIDKDGIQEYIITENYEGELKFCFTYKRNKLVRFLSDAHFSDFLIEKPQQMWSITNESYIGWERNLGLLDLSSNVHCFNLTTFEAKYKFKLYKAYQIATSEKDLKDVELSEPKILSSLSSPKSFILNSSTPFYVDFSLPKQSLNMGTINKGSYGWILSDTLNAYFAVFDSTTSYVNDTLGMEKINYKDRGYMMCWIPKKVADFSIESGVSGLYEDRASKEYLRVVQTKDNLYVNYFSGKSFEKSLLIDSSNPTDKVYTVRFKKLGEKYLLEPKENYTIIECTNPNQTKQRFVRCL